MQCLKELSAEAVTTPPKVQKFERQQTLEREHKDAMERAVSLNIPYASSSAEEESSLNTEEESSRDKSVMTCDDETEPSFETEQPPTKNVKTNWSEIVQKLLKKNDSGESLLKRDTAAPGPSS